MGWIPPGCTELSAVKLPFSRVVEKRQAAVAASRSSNATSDGELTRVSTLGVEKGGPASSSDIRVVGKHAVDLDDDTC